MFIGHNLRLNVVFLFQSFLVLTVLVKYMVIQEAETLTTIDVNNGLTRLS